jgi:hypothetical protein
MNLCRSEWKIAALALGATCSLLAQPPAGGRGFGGFGFGGGMGLGNLTSKTITGAPFSATQTTQHTQTLSNGNTIQRQNTAQVYRDNEGRVRIESSFTETTSSGTQTVSEITLYDPVAGFVYRLNPQKMTGVQSPIRQRPAPPAGSTPPSNPNVTTVSLGTNNNINGVTATGTQVTRTIPAGTVGNTQPIQIVRVTWVSTTLQIPVQVIVTDPRTGTQTMNLTNIVQTEPTSTLFVVPSGYTITSAPGRGSRPNFRR